MACLTGGALHDIAEIFLIIVDATHEPRIIPYQHCLTSRRDHILVFHATEFACREARTVHNQLSSFTGMVGIGCVGDMHKDLSFEHDACFETLGDQPRKIDGRVDTNRCENISALYIRRQLVFWDWSVLPTVSQYSSG